ncbi:type II toxin-antitoxin system ParD family antitoxin [Belnapia sp. T6]|uniref:Type II toxin-antitoxin system ParD family antitoxin n=1 Tax=Belnapia mucosa TaxID=2804532 RepID=A0ABS1VBI0_9PROT|nr:type II toxin-antitoxin system ParD family antitoxin [Belnapia mucosa]
MAAKHTLHVALTEPLVQYVAERVASGEYATASEVVRTGLRLLIEQDAARPQRDSASPPAAHRRPSWVQRGAR